jgi:hypothetical protein
MTTTLQNRGVVFLLYFGGVFVSASKIKQTKSLS